MATAKRKIAIACQGGGSQTAFTAGVLKALFERDLTRHFEVVSLSGTSGGALCAMLVWYALFKGDDYVPSRLLKFWVDNTAQTDAERQFNQFLVESLRFTDKAQLPQFNASPNSPMMQAMLSLSSSQLRPSFTDLGTLLRQHIDFDELAAAGAQPELPALLIGATEIRTGRMAKFNSREGAIRLEHLLASCAVPNLFPAVEFDGQAYWDGLLSDNPPIDELVKVAYVGVENLPQEIWVIKINPTGSQRVPQSPEEIADRCNEMVGNLSLFHQLASIGFLNDLLLRGAFSPDFLGQFPVTSPVLIPKCFADEPDQPYHIPFIDISESLLPTLDHGSKLDRSPENVQRLIDDGERQAAAFLDGRLAALGLA